MANSEQIKILKQGAEAWNKWRVNHPEIKPDLVGAELRSANIGDANLRGANLKRADLCNSDLCGANLCGANLTRADLGGANLSRADLSDAKLSGSNLILANLRKANLRGARLRYAYLVQADLSEADLTGVNLYASARDFWKIEGVKCDFVVWQDNVVWSGEGKARIPKERNFKKSEFEDIYKQLPTIEYFFEHSFTPIDAFVMDQVVQAINEKHPEFELKLDSLHSRGLHPRAVLTVHHKDYAEDALDKIKVEYETRLKVLEKERDTLEKCFMMAIKEPRTYVKRLEMAGDIYKIHGQTGAVGPHSSAHDIHFDQLWNQASSDIVLAHLAKELSEIRFAMQKYAKTSGEKSLIIEIKAAEHAAKDGKGAKTLEHLKKAGTRALNVAEKIGASIATEALKRALGY